MASRIRNPDGTCPVCQIPNSPHAAPSGWICNDCLGDTYEWLQTQKAKYQDRFLITQIAGDRQKRSATRA